MSLAPRGLDPGRKLAWGSGTALVATAAGYAATALPELFHFDLQPSVGLFVLVGLLVAVSVAILRSAPAALILLILFVYLNLSEVLVRFHDLPSLLQILFLPLAVGAVLDGSGRRFLRVGLHPLTWLLTGYVILLGLSTTWAWDATVARAETLEAAKGLLLFVLVAVLGSSRDRLHFAAIALVGGGVFLASLSLFQVVGGDYSSSLGGLARIKQAQIYADVFEPRIAGPLGDPNYYAQILLLGVPLALVLAWRSRGWGRGVALGATAMLMAAILFTYSRGAAVALLVVLAMTLALRGVSRRGLLAGAAVLLLALSLAPQAFQERLSTLAQLLPGASDEMTDPDSSFAKRRLVTQAAWAMYLDHPVVGVGAGNYPVRFEPYGTQIGSVAPFYDDPGEAQYPHNLYLEVAAETGSVGLLLFAALLLVAFGSLARAWARLSRRDEPLLRDLAAALAIALVGYALTSLFLHGHFLRYLWLLLALATAWDVTARRRASEEPDGVRSARAAHGVPR